MATPKKTEVAPAEVVEAIAETTQPEVAALPETEVAPAEVVEAIAEDEEPSEVELKKRAIIESFMRNFASNPDKRKKIQALIDEDADPKKFASEFGRTDHHKRYMAARFEKLKTALAEVS